MSKGNSPAFPCVDNKKQVFTGMNLRDYFALESLEALIKLDDDIDASYIASVAYGIADAMLDEREKFR